jgi:hypothetical protein
MACDSNRRHDSSELEVQSRWFAGEFGREFEGTSGERIRVVQFGVWNRAAGPDFVDAAVEVNGSGICRGAIEIDMCARDWEAHGHSQNREYDCVVLHVFLAQGHRRMFTRTSNHGLVPQVHLVDGNGGVSGGSPLARSGRCARVLEKMSVDALQRELKEAAALRFRKRSRHLECLAEVHGEGEALFQGVASALGYPGNQLPFRLLAQRLPLKRLLEAPDNFEALLFGVSGFLPVPDLLEYPLGARRYARRLWERWWGHRASHAALVLSAGVWSLGLQRPANHPVRRLGALVQLLRQWKAFHRLVGARQWRQVRKLLGGLTHPFWNYHFTFRSRPLERPLRLLGRERVEEILINVLLPMTGDWDSLLGLKAPEQNRRSRIAAARVLGQRPDAAALLREAVCQQGALQLYEDFCCRDASDCLSCPYPEQAGSRWIRQ